MRKFYYLPQAHKNAYFDGKNKSKSPLNNFRKTPPRNIFQKNTSKNSEILGITFASKTSKKQQSKISKLNPTMKRLHYSHTNSQLGQAYMSRHLIDNIQQQTNLFRKAVNQTEQYFAASLNKISQIRKKYYSNKINYELDEVLNMIKQQKLKIGQKMKILKRNNEYYQQRYYGYVAETVNRETNTDQLLDLGFQKCYKDQQIQVYDQELQQKAISGVSSVDPEVEKAQRNLQKQRECYLKLCKMLDQMNISYEQILPQLDFIDKISSEKEYKMLGDAEVIKIQKFFIKKLAAKLPAGQ